jgi:hypothetical protein
MEKHAEEVSEDGLPGGGLQGWLAMEGAAEHRGRREEGGDRREEWACARAGCPWRHSLVGRTPWSAADAPVGLLASRGVLNPQATTGRGGPARTRGSAPLFSSNSSPAGEMTRLVIDDQDLDRSTEITEAEGRLG